MLYYLRKDVLPSVSKYTYKIRSFLSPDAKSEESSLNMGVCRYGYNISFKNGVIKSGIGINYATLSSGRIPMLASLGKTMKVCWHYLRYNYTTGQRDDRLVTLANDGKIYQTPIGSEASFTETGISGITGLPTALNYHYNGEDVLLIFLPTGGMYVYNGITGTHYTEVPPLSSTCLHYQRVYGTMQEGQNRIYYSDDLNPTNWTVSANEGGYISFPDEGGNVKKVVSFNDYVFIFREYAIHRLTAYAEQSEYKLSKVFNTNNKIYEKTIQICGNRLVFLAEDGLYSFDGYTAKKVFEGSMPLITDKSTAVGCYFNYKYYLSVKLEKNGEIIADERYSHINNGILIFDFDLNSVSIFRGSDIAYFLPFNTSEDCCLMVGFGNHRKGYLGVLDDSGELFGESLPKLWKSPKTDLDENTRKVILRRAYVKSAYPITLKIIIDDIEKEYSVNGGTEPQMLLVNQNGREFSVAMSTENDIVYIKSLMLEFEMIGEYTNE